MGQIIKTISVSKEEDQFLIDNNISPTRLIRNKIQEMMKFQYENKDNKPLYEKIDRMRKMIDSYAKFLENRGLSDEFMQT